MPKCVVKTCRNNTLRSLKKDGVTYHRFPRRHHLREVWRKIIAKQRRDKFYKPNNNSVVCSNHFLESEMYATDKGYRRLKKSAIPIIHIEGILTQENVLSSGQSGITPRVPESASSDDDSDRADAPPAPDSECGVLRVRTQRAVPACADSLQKELLMDMHTLHDTVVKFMPHLSDKQYTLHFKSLDGDEQDYIFASQSKSRNDGRWHGKDCSECGAGIRGRLYKCVSCEEHWMCQACDAMGLHADHVVMRISRPVKSAKGQEILKKCCQIMKQEGIDDLLKEKNKGDGKKSSHGSKSKDDGENSKDIESDSNNDDDASCGRETADKGEDEDRKSNLKLTTKRKSNTNLKSKSTKKDKIEDASNEERNKDPVGSGEVEIKIEREEPKEVYGDDMEVTVDEIKLFDADPLGTIKQEPEAESDPCQMSSQQAASERPAAVHHTVPPTKKPPDWAVQGYQIFPTMAKTLVIIPPESAAEPSSAKAGRRKKGKAADKGNSTTGDAPRTGDAGGNFQTFTHVKKS